MKQRRVEVPMTDDTKIALLENNIGQINDTLKRIDKRLDTVDAKLDKINDRMWSNFLWLLSLILSSSVGLAALIAHAMGWF